LTHPAKTVKTIIILHKMDTFLDEKDITILLYVAGVLLIINSEIGNISYFLGNPV
jgi:hypothetical protein